MHRRRLLIVVSAALLSTPLLLVLAAGRIERRPPADRAAPAVVDTADAPRLLVQQPIFDFGMMDPLTEGRHAFLIRNQGRSPLKLAAGSTTCKCTVSELPRQEIEPGGAGEVVLIWNTGRKDTFYQHGASIHTNDPAHPVLQLQVKGTVRVLLGAQPASLALAGVEPHRAMSAAVVVYSQLEQPFQIEQASCSLPGSTVTVAAAELSQLEPLQAVHGHRLRVQLPAGMAEGAHQGLLQITARHEGSAEPEMLEVPIAIEVLRRLALYGPGIDMTGTLDLGVLKAGEGLRRRLVMKVRDELAELQVRQIQVQPEWLKVELSEYHTRTAAGGLYYLDVEVPADAPVSVHRGHRAGRIQLEIEHPRISDLTLQVQVAVTGGQQ